MDQITTALVGCGKAGEIHASALRDLPTSRFRAVCDRDKDSAEAFAERFGVRAYGDVAEMVSEEQVQAVCVATPHRAHAAPAISAATAGAHVLVEKPLAVTLADCDEVIASARAADVKLGVISQRRLYEPVQRVKRAIDEGKIGRPVLGTVVMLGWRDDEYFASDPWRGTWRGEGGGVLVNQAPHQLDLLQWFMGPIDEVYGYWGNLNHPRVEVEDTAVAVLRFRNGGMGSVVVSNSQKPGLYGKVHVHGENGASVGVQTDGGAMFIAGVTEILGPPITDLWTVPGEEDQLEHWQAEDRQDFMKADPIKHYHRIQIQDFLSAVIEDREPLVTGLEGRKTVELFTAIYRSQEIRGPVAFPVMQ
ncbi:MAG: Gfo/Idh/MocA family oxidoreductase [Gammaproteobacteria bacterium]|nr:Gfo/Idh/MocA family oxidoreductase [Gammaproteobacteria bacterium]